MPITVHCSGCQRHLQVDEKHAGKLLKCPLCGKVDRVPVAAAPVMVAPIVAEEVPDDPSPAPARASAPPSRPRKKKRRGSRTGAGEVFIEQHEADGALPDVCMCCGNEGGVWRTQNFSWIHPLMRMLPPIAVAFLTKKMTVQVPLCDQHQNHFLWRTIVEGGFGGILLILGLLWVLTTFWAEEWTLPLGISLVFFVVIWIIAAAVLKSMGIRVSEINDDGIRLKGVSPGFHEALEDHRDAEDEEYASGSSVKRKGRRRRVGSASGSGSTLPWLVFGIGAIVLLACTGTMALLFHALGVVGNNLGNFNRLAVDGPPAVEAVAITPDGRLACLGQSDGKVAIVDLETGQEVRQLVSNDDAEIFAVAISPDGKQLLAGGSYYTAEGDEKAFFTLWDVQGGREIRKFQGLEESVSHVAFSPNGLQALSASADGSVRLWDVQTGKELRRFTGPGRPEGQAFSQRVLCATFSPDGKYVAASGFDVQVQIWDTESGKHLKTLTHPALNQGRGVAVGMIPDLAFTPDSKRLVSLGPNSMISWDVERGTKVKTIPIPEANSANKLSIPSSVRAVTSHHDGVVRVWNLETGTMLHEIRSHDSSMPGLAVTRDGKRAITGALNGWVVLYDVNEGKELKRIRQPKDVDPGDDSDDE